MRPEEGGEKLQMYAKCITNNTKKMNINLKSSKTATFHRRDLFDPLQCVCVCVCVFDIFGEILETQLEYPDNLLRKEETVVKK